MKKNLRMLCMGLAAAAFTCSFAQTAQDMTSLLKNTDMEEGLKGWSFEGERFLGKNTKNLFTRPGFYGMSGAVLEAWNGNAENGIPNGYLMQRVGGELENGTYVFGAYVGASKQNHRSQILDEEGKGTGEYKFWSNRDSISGVCLFAGDSTVSVGTNNPDWNDAFSESHSGKFNVAVVLTDSAERPGYMDLGIRYTNTNANYIVIDNPTFYYFGDMSTEEALDAMAKIDLENVIAVADTFVTNGVVMHKDTMAALQTAIDAAKEKNTTNATLWSDSEELFFQMGLARKSESDYSNLKKNIESAKKLLDMEWAMPFTNDALAILEEALAEAEEAYNGVTMNRDELNAVRKYLNWSAGDVKTDSLYYEKGQLQAFIDVIKQNENQPGYYSSTQRKVLEDLLTEVNDTVAVLDEEVAAVMDGEIEFEERTLNPNNLIPFINKIREAVANVKDNPISMEYTIMPIQFKAGADGWVEGTEMHDQSLGVVAYTSPMYRFQGKIEFFRITVNKAKNGQKYFCLSGLEFFDGTGAKIELSEANLSTNADHNTMVNGEGVQNTADGGGIPALFDNDAATYFHSAWQNGPAEAHYLEVTLPDGGYDAFSFRMLGRFNGSGYDQSHTFPGEMVISTPMPNRAELETLYAGVKELGAYSANDPGLLKKDFPELNAAIAKVGKALEGHPSEDECKAMYDELIAAIELFQVNTETEVYLPEAGKKYRLISAVPYYDKQYVEKAMTIQGDSCLVWENVCADSLMQEFMFEPLVNEDDEPYMEEVTEADESINYIYGYTMKSAKSGLFVELDTVHQSTLVKFNLVKETKDTLRLKFIGRGQWQLIPAKYSDPKHCQLHTQGHGEGSGTSGTIVGWNVDLSKDDNGNVKTALGSASAWYIRELAELPMTVLAENAAEVFKSECVHFAAANTITLKADKDCAFENLVFVDFYGMPIVGELTVEGNTATFIPEHNAVACAFSFTNTEAVASVEFNAYMYTAAMDLLQAAYDEAVAFNPTEGTEVMQYADVTAYTAALEEAEAMLESGVEDFDVVDAMIEKLEKVVEELEPNMPVEGKYYFIYSSVKEFEKNKGYRMTFYSDNEYIHWRHENHLNWNQYWQFEQATVEELKAAKMDSTACAFFLKSVATEKYVGDIETVDGKTKSLVAEKADAMPIVLTSLGDGEAALDGLGQSGKRIHANNHGGGSGNGSNIVYWGYSGLGSASSWTIVETQYDVNDIDFTEVETEKPVVKGTFDLFGRRIDTPTAPGIYIIDGKKKYIKK